MLKPLHLFCLILFTGAALQGQDTIYYNKSKVVDSIEEATDYHILFKDETDTNKVKKKVYFKEGNLKSEGYYSDYLKRIFHGSNKEWYENGQLLSDINYDHGKKHGSLITYWENGNLKRKDLFENDILIEGTCFDLEGNEIPHFEYMTFAEFPGGIDSLLLYLKKNIIYPPKSKRKGITGLVIIQFTINNEGEVQDEEVIKSVNNELDEEALRVVRSLPKWKPGTLEGEPVSVCYNIPINFRLR